VLGDGEGEGDLAASDDLQVLPFIRRVSGNSSAMAKAAQRALATAPRALAATPTE